MKEYKYKINGNTYKVAVGDIDNNVAQVEVNGTPYKVEIDAPAKPVTIVNAPRPSAAPRTAGGEKVINTPAPTGSGHKVVAPLPGTVLSIAVKADTVLVLEAMKMENAIHAGRDGKVASVNVAAGDSVLEGAVLITLE